MFLLNLVASIDNTIEIRNKLDERRRLVEIAENLRENGEIEPLRQVNAHIRKVDGKLIQTIIGLVIRILNAEKDGNAAEDEIKNAIDIHNLVEQEEGLFDYLQKDKNGDIRRYMNIKENHRDDNEENYINEYRDRIRELWGEDISEEEMAKKVNKFASIEYGLLSGFMDQYSMFGRMLRLIGPAEPGSGNVIEEATYDDLNRQTKHQEVDRAQREMYEEWEKVSDQLIAKSIQTYMARDNQEQNIRNWANIISKLGKDQENYASGSFFLSLISSIMSALDRMENQNQNNLFNQISEQRNEDLDIENIRQMIQDTPSNRDEFQRRIEKIMNDVNNPNYVGSPFSLFGLISSVMGYLGNEKDEARDFLFPLNKQDQFNLNDQDFQRQLENIRKMAVENDNFLFTIFGLLDKGKTEQDDQSARDDLQRQLENIRKMAVENDNFLFTIFGLLDKGKTEQDDQSARDDLQRQMENIRKLSEDKNGFFSGLVNAASSLVGHLLGALDKDKVKDQISNRDDFQRQLENFRNVPQDQDNLNEHLQNFGKEFDQDAFQRQIEKIITEVNNPNYVGSPFSLFGLISSVMGYLGNEKDEARDLLFPLQEKEQFNLNTQDAPSNRDDFQRQLENFRNVPQDNAQELFQNFGEEFDQDAFQRRIEKIITEVNNPNYVGSPFSLFGLISSVMGYLGNEKDEARDLLFPVQPEHLKLISQDILNIEDNADEEQLIGTLLTEIVQRGLTALGVGKKDVVNVEKKNPNPNSESNLEKPDESPHEPLPSSNIHVDIPDHIFRLLEVLLANLDQDQTQAEDEIISQESNKMIQVEEGNPKPQPKAVTFQPPNYLRDLFRSIFTLGSNKLEVNEDDENQQHYIELDPELENFSFNNPNPEFNRLVEQLNQRASGGGDFFPTTIDMSGMTDMSSMKLSDLQ